MQDWNETLKYSIYGITGVYPMDELGNMQEYLALNKIDDLLEALVNGADPNIIVDNNSGQTAIHYCTHFGRIDTLSELLKYGGSPDAQDREGNTGLHFILRNFRHTISDGIETISLLLENGASFDIKNNKNIAPIDLVKSINDPEIIKLFEKTIRDRKNEEQVKLKNITKSNRLAVRRHFKNRKMRN